MKSKVYIGLLHYPVFDKDGRVITAAVTNLDLHDLARLRASYGLEGYYVIQPLELQARLVRRLTAYWVEGPGGDYNSTRREAFARTSLVADLDAAVAAIEAEQGARPRLVFTSARRHEGLRHEIGSDCGAGFQPAPGPAQDAGWKPAPQSGRRQTPIPDAARRHDRASTFSEIRAMLAEGGVWLILFGVGWGIADDFIRARADYLLEPIDPGSGYNHLSVRTAAAIVIDRLLG